MRLTNSKNEEKNTANLQRVKDTNLALVFNMIYRSGSISRAELAQRTKLSPTTVSSLIEELLFKGVVMETGTGMTAATGRKPIMLEINAGGGFVISYEMVEGGFHCCLYNLLCRQVDGKTVRIRDFADVGIKMTEAAESLLKDNSISEEKLTGISIGVPGLIDYEKKRVISSTVIAVDERNDFYSRIRDRFPAVPVFLENESSLCAYAEKEFGVEGDIRNLVFIDINIGIGSGIVIDGNMYRGIFGAAGEIGHVSIDYNGPVCKCGNRGCLEIMASVPAVIQKVVYAVMSGRETIVKDITDNDLNRINMDVIKKAIDHRDGLALEILDETASRLASGINNVVNLINPQAVVIGGEIVKMGEMLLRRLKEKLASIGLEPFINRVNIGYSTLGSDAATLGGARYALDNILKIPSLGGE